MKFNAWKKSSLGYAELFNTPGPKNSPYAVVLIPRIAQIVKKFTTQTSKILDMGCGEGYLTRNLYGSRKHVYGCDISPELVRVAQHKSASIKYWVQNIEKLCTKEPDNKYSIIIANLVFPYIQHLARAVKTINTNLVQNGIALISLPHPCFNQENTQRWFVEEKNRPLEIIDYANERVFLSQSAITL